MDSLILERGEIQERTQRREVHDLLEQLLPGVFLATAAYSNEEEFGEQIQPKICMSKLLSIQTPDTLNDTQVHVALVKEWDPKFFPPGAANPSVPAVNLVFSFRGTEPWQACDWLQDLNYKQRAIAWWPTWPRAKAHDGFLFSLESCTEYKSVSPNGTRTPFCRQSANNDASGRTLDWAVNHVIQEYNKEQKDRNRNNTRRNADADTSAFADAPSELSTSENDNDDSELTPANLTRIVVVGHSLGGAIATVASVWARVKLPDYIPELRGKHVTCITTGCPRVGNTRFKHEYSTLMENENFESYRVVNNFDVVPSVPLPAWGFCHVGIPIWFKRVRNNWGCHQLTITDTIVPLVNGNSEVTSRPHGYGTSLGGGQISDHFQWHYNRAISEAVATTVSYTQEQFSRDETDLQRIFRGYLTGPRATIYQLVFNVLGLLAVSVGASFLVNEKQQRTRIPGPLHRMGINLLLIFFTAPLWLITHVVYWLDS